MFSRLGSQTSAILIIFFIFLAIFFLCQIFSKIGFQIKRKRTKTNWTGEEIYQKIISNPQCQELRLVQAKHWSWSSFYSYQDKNKSIILNENQLKKTNLDSSFQMVEALVYSQRRNRFLRWQFYGIWFLSLVPYLLFIAIMLLTFLPEIDVNGRVPMWSWITIEALAIISWIILLIIYFWWITLFQNFNEEVSQVIKVIDDQSLASQLQTLLSINAYVPFSIRTII